MTPNRITRRFRENAQARVGGLLPYFTAGFPDAETTEALIVEADRLGASVIELGFPFSDSIADGPVIQQSFYRVLSEGHRVEDTFQLVSNVRSSIECGLVAMVSYSLVHRIGLDSFMDRAAEAGFDGVILPDVPVEESRVTVASATRVGLCHIGLVAPTSSALRKQAIANASTGFIYQIATAGTTGERGSLPPHLPAEVQQLRAVSGVPVCVGFGVSDAEQVREICRFANGAIVGSAIIRRIDEAVRDGADRVGVVDRIGSFLRTLVVGLSPCG